MSSLVPSAQVPSTAPVAGSRFSKTAPLLAGTRRPSIRLRVSGARGASAMGASWVAFRRRGAGDGSRLRDLHCGCNVFSVAWGDPWGAAGGTDDAARAGLRRAAARGPAADRARDHAHGPPD